MGFKVITVLLPLLLLPRGLYGAVTRHVPEGDACTHEKYEGGDGTVDISKCDQSFDQLLLLDFCEILCYWEPTFLYVKKNQN